MEIFYSDHVTQTTAILPADESLHCIRVLRHREGDLINVVDGDGSMYECKIVNDHPKMVVADILSQKRGWNVPPYDLTMAVCPTKNNDRFEWFIEKATEIGLNRICPVIGDRSERRVYKTERARKLVLSAGKQSLKSLFPKVDEPVSVRDFIKAEADAGVPHRFIACCFEDDTHPRKSFVEALAGCREGAITVLIGPEGDFSPDELQCALDAGFVPVHLGNSRLRTETAAVVATADVYAAIQ